MASENNPFSNKQYLGQVFKAADMTGAFFNGVDLSHCKIFAVAVNARFVNCNMASSGFDDVNLGQAVFENVNLSNARFHDVNLAGVEINNANIEGMTINGILLTDLLSAYEERKVQ